MAVIAGSFLVGCGSSEGGLAPPAYTLLPASAQYVLWQDRTDVIAGVTVLDAKTGQPVSGVAVTFCATRGAFDPVESTTGPLGVAPVAWSVAVAADTAVLSAGVAPACGTPIAVALPR